MGAKSTAKKASAADSSSGTDTAVVLPAASATLPKTAVTVPQGSIPLRPVNDTVPESSDATGKETTGEVAQSGLASSPAMATQSSSQHALLTDGIPLDVPSPTSTTNSQAPTIAQTITSSQASTMVQASIEASEPPSTRVPTKALVTAGPEQVTIPKSLTADSVSVSPRALQPEEPVRTGPSQAQDNATALQATPPTTFPSKVTALQPVTNAAPAASEAPVVPLAPAGPQMSSANLAAPTQPAPTEKDGSAEPISTVATMPLEAFTSTSQSPAPSNPVQKRASANTQASQTSTTAAESTAPTSSIAPNAKESEPRRSTAPVPASAPSIAPLPEPHDVADRTLGGALSRRP